MALDLEGFSFASLGLPACVIVVGSAVPQPVRLLLPVLIFCCSSSGARKELPPDRANLFEIIDADGSGTLHVAELAPNSARRKIVTALGGLLSSKRGFIGGGNLCVRAGSRVMPVRRGPLPIP